MAERRLELELARYADRLGKIDPDMVGRTVEVGLREALLLMQRDLQQNKLSGQYLGIVTGQARRSIQYRTRRDSAAVHGVIGSPFRYVRAHEEGFRGRVQVSSFYRWQRGKGSAGNQRVQVRAHTRRMNLRARHFLRDTMRENAGKTRLRILRALRLLLDGPVLRPPTQGEVRSGFLG